MAFFDVFARHFFLIVTVHSGPCRLPGSHYSLHTEYVFSNSLLPLGLCQDPGAFSMSSQDRESMGADVLGNSLPQPQP